MSHEEYQAGTCNIGTNERSQRRLAGYASLVVGIVYLLGVLALDLPGVYGAGLGVFAFGGAIGLLQSRERFCVAYGMAGQYGFDDGSGSVEDAGQRSRDRKHAIVLSAKAGAVAVVGAIAGYGLLTVV